MVVEYVVVDNDDTRFPETVLIETVENGVVTSRSWASSEVPVEARLNLDHPSASERRTGTPSRTYDWKPPSAEVARVLGIDEELRAALIADAISRGLTVTDEALLRRNLAPADPTPTRRRAP